jgi:hypothetical protein
MMLTIPPDGLAEMRRVWAGRGGLWAGVAGSRDDDGYVWTPEVAHRRAARVIIELLRSHLLAWPSSARNWVDALPAQSVKRRVQSDVPGPGVDWAATRRTGWPPRTFHHRRRSRVADTLLVTVTRWTIEELARMVEELDRLGNLSFSEIEHERLNVAVMMLGREPLASSLPSVPSRADLAALRSSGRPWTSVAAVAGWLRILDHDPARLAELPIEPDPALANRLFHVAVTGTVLRGFRDAGWSLAVSGLAGMSDGRPQFMMTDPDGTAWDVWFEMAGAWSHYGVPCPYPAAVSGIAGTGGPLGADIALVRCGDRAVIIECKFSANPVYVGRGGYEQTLAYMSEARSGLVDVAVGIVVGPDEVVASTGRTTTAAGQVVVTNPSCIGLEVANAISGIDRLTQTGSSRLGDGP